MSLAHVFLLDSKGLGGSQCLGVGLLPLKVGPNTMIGQHITNVSPICLAFSFCFYSLMMIMDKPKYSMEQWHAQVAAAAHHHQQQQQQLVAAAAAAHHHAAAAAAAADDKVFAAASLMARQGGAAPHVSSHGGPASVVGPPPPTNPFLAAAAAQHSAMGLGPLQLPGVSKSLTAQAGPPVPPPPPFRYPFGFCAPSEHP